MTRARRQGVRRKACARGAVLALAVLLVLSAVPARSHDPSAWGGLFRSHDHGASWVSANRGTFLSGAIALAISPTDPNHLLLGTESGLFRSRNGGRDWNVEAPSILRGSVFALSFAGDGQRAMASTGVALFLSDGENRWRQAPAPRGAVPARAIVRGGKPERIYLAGWRGLYRSDDWGASWSDALPSDAQDSTTALIVVPGPPETLYAVVGGRIWKSVSDANSWTGQAGPNLPATVDALAADPRRPEQLWAAAGSQVFGSRNAGATWQPAGPPLPEAAMVVNGIAANGETIVLATDRGLCRSIDGGRTWAFVTDNLPAHLEASSLVRDPVESALLYAGFTLTPYRELWRRAASHEDVLVHVSAPSLVGGGVFLLLLVLAAVTALRWLGRYYRPSAAEDRPMWSARDRRAERETLP